MHALAVLTAFVTAASAYMVVQPNTVNGWTDSGPQPVSWDRVSTDPTNFTIVLTNTVRSLKVILISSPDFASKNRALWPQDQVLVAEQDGVNVKNIEVNPPSGGWPSGPGFRVNFVRNVDNQNTIYAQSNEFAISVATTTATARTTAGQTGTTIQANPVTTRTGAATPANSITPSGNASPPGTSTGTNGAAAVTVGSSLMVLLAVISYVVA